MCVGNQYVGGFPAHAPAQLPCGLRVNTPRSTQLCCAVHGHASMHDTLPVFAEWLFIKCTCLTLMPSSCFPADGPQHVRPFWGQLGGLDVCQAAAAYFLEALTFIDLALILVTLDRCVEARGLCNDEHVLIIQCHWTFAQA